MPEMQPYEYAVIRLVPIVEREEFLNVGVILYSKDARFLQMKVHLPQEKIQVFAPGLDISEIERYLLVWQWICVGDVQGGPIASLDLPNRFRWLTAVRSTIIQSSRIHPGMSASPSACLEKLFEQYVR